MTTKRCRLCLIEWAGEEWQAEKLTKYDLEIGDGLCERHRLAEQVKEAKRAWYGTPAAEAGGGA